jgi:hypothetical protein
MQAGKALPAHKEAAKQVLKPSADDCSAKCNKQAQQCYASQGVSMDSASKEQHQKCLDSAKTCIMTCPAVL